MTDFSGGYSPNVLHFMYGTSIPGGGKLGEKLSDNPTSLELYVGAITVAGIVLLVLTAALIYTLARKCCCPPQERSKSQKLTRSLPVTVAVGFFLLVGLALPVWAAVQNVITTPLPSVLRQFNDDSLALMTAINSSLTLSQLANTEARAHLTELMADSNALVVDAAATTGTCDAACQTAAADMVVESTALRTAMGGTFDDTEALRDTLTSPWNPADMKDVEDMLDSVWIGMTTITVLTATLLGGATGALVLEAWRAQNPEAHKTDDKKTSTCYVLTWTLLTVMVWLGVFFGVVLAVVATAGADISSNVCKRPYAVLDAYLETVGSSSSDLTQYYLHCGRDETVYRCDHPVYDDITSVRDSIQLARDTMTDIAANELLVWEGLNPGVTQVPLPSRVAAAASLLELQQLFVGAIHGPADCSIIAALIDQQLTNICDDPGIWLSVTAVCYTATVVVVIMLHTTVVFIRSGNAPDPPADPASGRSKRSGRYHLVQDRARDKVVAHTRFSGSQAVAIFQDA